MTPFQLLMVVVFAGIVAATYGKDIYAKLGSWWRALKPGSILPTPSAPPVSAQAVVDDLLIVASLRDRFAAENCAEGVDACSILLKIIIDHKHPHAG